MNTNILIRLAVNKIQVGMTDIKVLKGHVREEQVRKYTYRKLTDKGHLSYPGSALRPISIISVALLAVAKIISVS